MIIDGKEYKTLDCSLGEMVIIGQRAILLKKRKPFFYKYERNELNKMTPSQKEKLFLRWKWFSENDDANQAAEGCDKIGKMGEEFLKNSDEYTRVFWALVKSDTEFTNKLKKDLGINYAKNMQNIRTPSTKVDWSS